jgi:predicted protein tyrosine phosphatase
MLLINKKSLKKEIVRATKVEKECLNSMEDIEHCHQTMFDMKEQHRRNVIAFVKATQPNSNHMHLACILAT